MIKVKINDREYSIAKNKNKYILNQEEFEFDFYQRSETKFHIVHNNLSINVDILHFEPEKRELKLLIEGKIYHSRLVGEQDQLIEKMQFATGKKTFHQKLISPMPGLIQKIFVREGGAVSPGDPLIILNAMKMENNLKSPVDGVITSILVREGDQVEKGKVLIQF